MNQDNLTLKDLQPEIFDKIPDLLESLPLAASSFENAGNEIENSDAAEFHVYLKGYCCFNYHFLFIEAKFCLNFNQQ